MLADEHILSLTDAARSLPKINGRRPHPSTLWRWARRGINGVHLEVLRLGGRLVTSTQALERFAQRLAQQPPQGNERASGPKLRPRTNRQREAAIAQAEAELAKTLK